MSNKFLNWLEPPVIIRQHQEEKRQERKLMWVDLQEIANHYFLRFDYKFHKIQKYLSKNWINIGSLFKIINGISCTEYYSEEKTNLSFIRIGDLSFGEEIDEENLIYLDESFQIPKEKILQKDDLILATIGNTIGKINLANNLEGGTFSNNTALLRLKNRDNHNIKFYEKLIKSKKIQEIIWCFVSQKAQPNLQDYDLKKIPLPQIPLSTQNEAVAKIQPIEQQIKELKSKIVDQKQIINEVFAREFGFDLEKFEELKKGRMFFVELENINTELLRFTTIQNSPRANYIKSFLSKINIIKIKDFLVKDIVRGRQPDYKEDGIKVVKTINISKNGNIYFDFENTTYVSEEFTNKSKEKLAITNDILLSSTGMGRGKFALYDLEESSLVDSHISIIRYDTNKIKPLFFNYFAQSFFGSEQLRYIEMQIKGTPEIYEEQLKHFQLPNLPLSHQQKIVDEIKAKIDKQNEINKQIETLRGKIDEIINEVVESVS